MKSEETGKVMGKLYSIAQIFGMIMAFAMIIMVYFVSKVKDSSKYGAKVFIKYKIILILKIKIINYILFFYFYYNYFFK